MSRNNFYLALIHHPVTNKKGKTIASALTTIDMHDIARAAITYGIRGFYVVTPLTDQQILAHEVISHWTDGVGGKLNPFRKMALELIRVVPSFENAVTEIMAERKQNVHVTATTAKRYNSAISTRQFAERLNENTASHIMTFGTAWGLSENFIANCDDILEPVTGASEYNHLSVRSAVSIILDRIHMNQISKAASFPLIG